MCTRAPLHVRCQHQGWWLFFFIGWPALQCTVEPLLEGVAIYKSRAWHETVWPSGGSRRQSVRAWVRTPQLSFFNVAVEGTESYDRFPTSGSNAAAQNLHAQSPCRVQIPTGVKAVWFNFTPCVCRQKMTAVGLEPTPLRTGA